MQAALDPPSQTCPRMHKCGHTCVRAYMYVCVCVHTCVRVGVRACVHVCMRGCLCACVGAYVHAWVLMCMRPHTIAYDCMRV